MQSNSNLNKSLFLSTLFLLTPLFSFAARIYLTPTNLTECVNKVLYMHQDKITTDPGNISIFLSDNISGGYRPALEAPVPEIAKVEVNTIKFNWNFDVDAVEYIIRYFNLSTGSQNTYTTTSTSIDINIPNDLYLFTFQIKDPTGHYSKSRVITERKGPKVIIIEDKPLSSVLNQDCACQNIIGSAQSQNIGGTESLITPFSPESSDKFYHVLVKSLDLSGILHKSDYYFRFITDADNLNFVAIYNDDGIIYSNSNNCTSNMDMMEIELSFIYALNTDFAESDEEFRVVRFGFDGGLHAISLEPALYPATSLTVTRCAHNLPTPPSNRIGLSPTDHTPVKISPNPGTGMITLDYSKPGNIPNTIQILNNYGQVMQEFSAFQTKVQANIEELPAGIYYVKSISASSTQTSAYVKI